MGWQRARRPEQKRRRREDLLDAAAALFEAEGYAGVSLAAIARGAGVTKASVYRYFESKEAIFLRLLLADTAAWVEELELTLAPLAGADDAHGVGRAVGKTLIARPRLCALMALTASVLERNITVEAVVAFKQRMLSLTIRAVNALHAALPSLSVEAAQALVRHAHYLIAGMWPAAHPPPAVAEALERPELTLLCADFERDLTAGLIALIRGFRDREPVEAPAPRA